MCKINLLPEDTNAIDQIKSNARAALRALVLWQCGQTGTPHPAVLLAAELRNMVRYMDAHDACVSRGTDHE